MCPAYYNYMRLYVLSYPDLTGKGLSPMKIATYVKSTLAASTLILAAAALPATAYAETAFYQVSNVERNDSLNIRSGAGTSYPVIGTIPFNGRTLMSTGQTQQSGRSTWVEIVWLGKIGWVNKRFLTESGQVSQQPVSQQPTLQQRSADRSRDNSRTARTTRDISRTQNNANTHTHPSNRCTRSVTHTHPNGARPHKHNYSCDPNGSNTQVNTNAPAPAVKSNYQANVPADPNLHTHPRNECTNSVTHSHPNGARPHQHHYSCKKATAAPQPQYNAQAKPKYNPQPDYSNTNDYYAIQ